VSSDVNVNTFLQHWRIRRNPFADEEAQHDEVFTRLRGDAFEHFELPKILGDSLGLRRHRRFSTTTKVIYAAVIVVVAFGAYKLYKRRKNKT